MASEEDDPSDDGVSPSSASTSEVIGPPRLLILPVEIRDMIWNMVLDDYKDIAAQRDPCSSPPKYSLRLPWVHLRQSCKQINGEIASILSSRHHFFEIMATTEYAEDIRVFIGHILESAPWSGTLFGAFNYETLHHIDGRFRYMVDRDLSDQELLDIARNEHRQIVNLCRSRPPHRCTTLTTSARFSATVKKGGTATTFFNMYWLPWTKSWTMEIRIEIATQ